MTVVLGRRLLVLHRSVERPVVVGRPGFHVRVGAVLEQKGYGVRLSDVTCIHHRLPVGSQGAVLHEHGTHGFQVACPGGACECFPGFHPYSLLFFNCSLAEPPICLNITSSVKSRKASHRVVPQRSQVLALSRGKTENNHHPFQDRRCTPPLNNLWRLPHRYGNPDRPRRGRRGSGARPQGWSQGRNVGGGWPAPCPTSTWWSHRSCRSRCS